MSTILDTDEKSGTDPMYSGPFKSSPTNFPGAVDPIVFPWFDTKSNPSLKCRDTLIVTQVLSSIVDSQDTTIGPPPNSNLYST